MLSKTRIRAGDVIDADDLASMSVTSAKNGFGSNYASLKFRLVDDGGVANAGLTTEKTAHTLTFNITDVTDTFTGTVGKNVLKGTAGHDVLNGKGGDDVLYAGTGNDKFTGGIGQDKLYDEAGADAFIFTSVKDTTVAVAGRDTIYDFTSADLINLSAIDANTKWSGNQAFGFIGTEAFSGKAGELSYDKQSSDTYVYGDVNGDMKADFAIHLDDPYSFTKGDFMF